MKLSFLVWLTMILFSTAANTSTSTVASTYEFKSRFQDTDSVSYTGQTFRNLLMSDLTQTLLDFDRGTYYQSEDEAFEAIWSYIDYIDNNDSFAQRAINSESEILTGATSINGLGMNWTEGYTYGDLNRGAQILNKLAGIDNPLSHGELLGWNLGKSPTPEDLLRTFAMAIAKNSANRDLLIVKNLSGKEETIRSAYVSESGLDYRQLIQKFLYGSLVFSQIAEDYLNSDLGEGKGLLADNIQQQKSNTPYTTLEHYWDEGFGYFGAARDYLSYSRQQTASGQSIDSNNDGGISLKTEKNFGLAMIAARRELHTGLPLSTAIYNDFLKGRALITERPSNYLNEVKTIADNIILNIEKVFAATVIHYINKTIESMDNISSDTYSFALHAKYWSEMKGFALAFQFNPKSPLSKAEFIQLHDELGDQPVIASNGLSQISIYREKLEEIRKLLQTKYGFQNESVQNW